jgi:hypothetical protein
VDIQKSTIYFLTCSIVDFLERRILQSTLLERPSELSALAMRDADPEPAGSGKIRQRRVVVQRHACPPPPVPVWTYSGVNHYKKMTYMQLKLNNNRANGIVGKQ